MPTNTEYRRTLLDAARAEPNRRERRRLLLAAGGYAAVFFLSVFEIFNQSISRRIVGVPKWWFAWIVFGCPGLVCLFLSVSRFLVARSLGNLPGWTVDALARLPPKIARLVGLTSTDTQSRGGNGGGGSFALGGGVFVGGDTRGGTEMTTPEVLRSTSLRSRSAARNASTTPHQQQQRLQQQQAEGGGDAGAKTPARGTPSERRLFSPEDAGKGLASTARSRGPAMATTSATSLRARFGVACSSRRRLSLGVGGRVTSALAGPALKAH